MRIGVLTGGGDVPGLNSAIKSLVRASHEKGWEVVGFKRGWQGLVDLDPNDPQSIEQWSLPLTWENTRTIDRHGGTFLHSSRTNPGKMKPSALPSFLENKAGLVTNDDGTIDATAHVLKTLDAMNIDVLVPIGGDDTLSYGERLYKEGFKVIGIPKTMDNDVHGTDYCLGFATCISRTVRLVHDLRTSVGSHERIGVIEVMGRNAGYTSLLPAYLADIDRSLIAEVPYNIDRLTELLVSDKKRNPSGYSMVIVSEGALPEGGEVFETGEADAYGHKKLGGIGKHISDQIKQKTGINTLYQFIGYMIRCGAPDPIDVMVTFNFARLATELIEANNFGNLVRIKNGHYGHAPMSILSEGLNRVDVARHYDSQTYRPRFDNIEGLPMYLTGAYA